MTREEIQALPLAERERLARDPLSPSALLESLYRDWERRQPLDAPRAGIYAASQWEESEVADALAANPNSPVEMMLLMAGERPAAFCANPLAPLLPLEVPDMVCRMPSRHQAWLLRRGDVPASVVHMIAVQARDPRKRVEAAMHVALVGEAGRKWLDEVRSVLVSQSREPELVDDPVIRNRVFTLAAQGGVPDFIATVSGQLLPAHQGDPEPEKLRNILRAMLPVNDLKRPVPCFFRCLALAHPLTTSIELLSLHAGSLRWLERLGVALNPSVRNLGSLADSLAADGNCYVRAAARACLCGENISL